MSEKWGRRLFTIGAVWLILLGCFHAISLFEDLKPANATEKQLLDLMTSYHFNFLGSMRSMDDLLRGFSTCFMLSPMVLGVVDLAIRRERTGLLKRVSLIQVIWLVLMVGVSLRYFFAAPTVSLVIPLLLFGGAWLKLAAEATG